MDGAQELQEFYSSTSSDDQSSINSVVHVGNGVDTSESDLSAPTTPNRTLNGHPLNRADSEEYGEEEEEMEDEEYDTEDTHGRLQGNHTGALMAHDDLSTTDSEDDIDERLRRADVEGQGRSDSSSTSSEETQIWVPVRPAKQASCVTQKPSFRHSAPLLPPTYPNSYHNNNNIMAANPPARNSVVSHNTATGKVEITLTDEAPLSQNGAATDSGYSNESPENHNHSSDGPHLHGYARNLPTPPPDPPGHQSTPRTGSHRSSLVGSSHPSSASSSSRGSRSSSQRQRINPDAVLQAHAVSLTQYLPASSQNSSHHLSLPVNGISATSSPNPGERERLHPADTEDEEMALKLRESLFNILSGLYAMLLVVFGLCLPISEIFGNDVDKDIIESFYIYLHLVSILFLCYVYCFLIRFRSPKSRGRFRRKCKRRETNSSRAEDIPLTLREPRKQRYSISSQSHTGSFYLRLGAIGFGIGAMIHEGLKLGQTLEYKLSPECIHITKLIRPVAQLAFTFFQLYFIFLNSRMCIHKYRTLARFGLMHMIATNMCVWLRVIIEETVHDISRFDHLASHSNKSHSSLSSHGPRTVNTSDGNHSQIICFQERIMGEVVENASPYLYPCTIEYSLIAAGILYIMWLNISQSPPPATPDTPSSNHHKKHLRMSVDCGGANRGLFFGIFTLVGTIISLIIFFVLVDKPGYTVSAAMVVHFSEIALYLLALIAVIAAAIKIRKLRFNPKHADPLDSILIIVSVVGIYVYGIFSIVAGRYGDNTIGGIFAMATNSLIMLQATVQTVFILNGLKRSPRNVYQETKRPGREFVTFLLVCNIGMWGINTFEILRADSNPLALRFYGHLPWSIITHISTPLAIFYRFHSTVCLSAIWKNAYKQKLT